MSRTRQAASGFGWVGGGGGGLAQDGWNTCIPYRQYSISLHAHAHRKIAPAASSWPAQGMRKDAGVRPSARPSLGIHRSRTAHTVCVFKRTPIRHLFCCSPPTHSYSTQASSAPLPVAHTTTFTFAHGKEFMFSNSLCSAHNSHRCVSLSFTAAGRVPAAPSTHLNHREHC